MTKLTGKSQLSENDRLMNYYSMSEAVYMFIITSYDSTMQSGKISPNQYWTLRSSFVKQIFTEL